VLAVDPVAVAVDVAGVATPTSCAVVVKLPASVAVAMPVTAHCWTAPVGLGGVKVAVPSPAPPPVVSRAKGPASASRARLMVMANCARSAPAPITISPARPTSGPNSQVSNRVESWAKLTVTGAALTVVASSVPVQVPVPA
jgi:hypothetical protein